MRGIELEIARLYKEDLKERTSVNIIPEDIIRHDKARKKTLNKLISPSTNVGNLSPRTLYYIAWIYHHGMTIADAQNAKKYAHLSFNSGFKKAGWLYAASTDRLLMRKGRPQKFGTQFYKTGRNAKWKLYKTDSSISDTERVRYGVLKLAEQKKEIAKLNKN